MEDKERGFVTMSCGEVSIGILKVIGYIILMRIIWGIIFIIKDVNPRCKTYDFLEKAEQLKEEIEETKENIDIGDCVDYFYRYMTSYDGSGLSEDKKNGTCLVFCKPTRYAVRVGKIILPCRITGMYNDGPSVTLEVENSFIKSVSIETKEYYL